MTELRASVVMDLRGNLERQSRRYEGAMRQMSTSGQRHMGRLQQVTGGLGRTLDRVGNRWVALATGVAGGAVVRNLVALEERFTRLGIQSGRTEEDMEALRRQIFATAREAEIRVDPGQITGAIEAIVEKTGDLEFAERNIRNIGMAISATGAEGSSIGEILAEFQKMDIREFDAVLQSIDTLNEQGKEGAFTLQNLASLGPRVVTAYTALGRQGPEAIREMGAALQVIRMGTGSSEQAATAFEALLRTFQNAEKAGELARKSGVQIFDPDELERGREVLRPINELMIEIVEAAQGRTSLLSDVFDAEAMRAFNAALGEYNRTGAVESMYRFFAVQGDGTATLNDSARAASTAAGAARNLSTTWQNFADSNFSQHIQEAADALNSLDQDTVDRWLQIGGMAAGGVAGLYAIRRLTRGLGRGRSTAGGIGGALGGAAGSMAPIPVYVTNWGPGGAGPGGAGPGGRGGPVPTGTPGNRAGHRVTRPSNWRMAMRAPDMRALGAGGAGVMGTAGLAVGAAGAAGYGVGTMINDHLISEQTGYRIGEVVAQVLANLGNENAQRALEINRAAERENEESTVRIRIDQDGRVSEARAEQGRGGPRIDIDTGPWGLWP